MWIYAKKRFPPQKGFWLDNMFNIVPAIDIRNGKCVRLEQGDYSRQTTYKDSPVHMAKQWESLGASLIHIVDLDGAKAGHPVNHRVIAEICASVSCQCELGGGIRTIDDAQTIIELGVARVIFGNSSGAKP